MSDIEFINGLIAKAPNERAPDFVKAQLSIKRAELIAWLQSRDDEWVNAVIKVSRAGNWFVAVNSYKKDRDKPKIEKAPGRQDHNDYSAAGPTSKHGDNFQDDDIPW